MILDTQVTKKDEGVLEVKCKVASSYIDKILSEVAYEVQGKSNLKGFRKGKAPMPMIRKLYGGQIKYDALNKILPEVYEKVVKDQDIKPVTMPQFDGYESIEEGKDLDFLFTIEIMPEIVEMATLDGISVKEQVFDFKMDEMVSKELDYLKETYAAYEQIDGEVVMGDFVKAKFKYEGDEPEKTTYFMLKEEDPYFVISRNFLGVKISEGGEADVDFPEDFIDKNFSGSKKKMTFALEEGKRVKYPQMDDEFAKKHNFETIAAMREVLEKKIASHLNEESLLSTADKIYEKILEGSRFDISPSFILEQSQANLTRKMNDLMMRGVNVEQYLKAEGLDQKNFIDKVKEDSLADIKKYLLVEKIAAENEIKVTDAEVNDYINIIKDLEVVNQDKIVDYYKKNKEALENVKNKLKMLKVAEMMKSKVKISGKEKKKLGDN
ncbi:MAG: trigger factor [Spirochaetae bacterium HGW-Spirochaetae-6]|nr:MAG: trigger factor [Spirochaetae bacterium HGW-Spirochaetae-6]